MREQRGRKQPGSLHPFSPFFGVLRHGAWGLFLIFCENLSKGQKLGPALLQEVTASVYGPGVFCPSLWCSFSTAESLR